MTGYQDEYDHLRESAEQAIRDRHDEEHLLPGDESGASFDPDCRYCVAAAERDAAERMNQ